MASCARLSDLHEQTDKRAEQAERERDEARASEERAWEASAVLGRAKITDAEMRKAAQARIDNLERERDDLQLRVAALHRDMLALRERAESAERDRDSRPR